MLAQIAGLFTVGGLAAAGAMAISIPITIHLLARLRRKPQRWAAMRFLIEAYRKQRQRIQVEQLLLLLVRCLIVAILGLALSGPLLGGLAKKLGVDAAGRTVFILIDDSLTTQAHEHGRGTRFELLRETALKSLDSLTAADRIAVWTIARPGLMPLSPPAPDRAAARDLIGKLKPRHSRADWPAALAALSDEIKRLNLPADRVSVILLSDFSVSSLDTTRPPTADLAALGSRAALHITRPMPSASNTQIASFTPRRTIALADPSGAVSIDAELRVRRFSADLPASLTSIDITAAPAPGTLKTPGIPVESDEPFATTRRDVRWAAGQSEVAVSVELRTSLAALGMADGAGVGTRAIVVRASALDAGAPDVLPADGSRVAIVEARRHMTLVIADEPSTDRVDGSWFTRPRDWIEAALTFPDAAGRMDTGPIRLTDTPAALLDERTLNDADAVLLLRPDQVTDAGWARLATLVTRGGFVWIFTPPSDAPAMWTAPLTEKLAPDWRLALEPSIAQPAPDGAWRLDSDHPAPEMMRLLAADWAGLVRPITVHKRLELSTRAGRDAAWLRLADAGDADTLLATTTLGEGSIMLMTTAIDPAWSNLPTKPFFIPLLHETLRGVIGASGDGASRNTPISGDQPALGRRWNDAQSLLTPSGQTLALRRTEQGVSPVMPLDEPGIYSTQPAGTAHLVVNLDADAGDTRAIDEQGLTRWLRSLGDWKWIDPANPLSAMAAVAPRSDIGWPLLWIVLALLLVETALARWFSHATK